MLEILKEFEQAAGELSPVIIAIPAIAMVIGGLLLWLAGLCLRRVLLAAAGAVIGAACGFFVIGRDLIVTAALTAVGSLVAVLLERLFIALLASIVAAAIVLAVLAKPQVDGTNTARQARSNHGTAGQAASNPSVSLEIIGGYVLEIGKAARRALTAIPIQHWAAAALAGVVFLVGGLILPRFGCAVGFSVVGTALIFAGIVLLLCYKGSTPVTAISARSSHYATVFAVMAGSGAVEQLLLCKKPFGKKKTSQKEETEQKDERSGRISKWRGM